MDFRHLIVTCLFSKLRLPFDNQKVKENYAIFLQKIPDESFRRNNRLLPVNFAKYDNMETYIEDNIRIALLNLFEVGFTLKGYKVKKR